MSVHCRCTARPSTRWLEAGGSRCPAPATEVTLHAPPPAQPAAPPVATHMWAHASACMSLQHNHNTSSIINHSCLSAPATGIGEPVALPGPSSSGHRTSATWRAPCKHPHACTLTGHRRARRRVAYACWRCPQTDSVCIHWRRACSWRRGGWLPNSASSRRLGCSSRRSMPAQQRAGRPHANLRRETHPGNGWSSCLLYSVPAMHAVHACRARHMQTHHTPASSHLCHADG